MLGPARSKRISLYPARAAVPGRLAIDLLTSNKLDTSATGIIQVRGVVVEAAGGINARCPITHADSCMTDELLVILHTDWYVVVRPEVCVSIMKKTSRLANWLAIQGAVAPATANALQQIKQLLVWLDARCNRLLTLFAYQSSGVVVCNKLMAKHVPVRHLISGICSHQQY
jgi:hypothetical protein